MRLKLVAIVCILTYGSIVLGDDCLQPVTALSQGQPAPCTGFLFSPAQEKKVRQVNQQLGLANEQLDVQNKQLSLYKDQNSMYKDIATKSETRAEVFRTAAVDSSEKLIKTEDNKGMHDVLVFAAGFIAAGFAAWLIHNAFR